MARVISTSRTRASRLAVCPRASMRDPNVPPSWLIYIQVADCAATTTKAGELGAKILMGNMHLDHVGNFTVMADPQGAVFAIYQPGE